MSKKMFRKKINKNNQLEHTIYSPFTTSQYMYIIMNQYYIIFCTYIDLGIKGALIEWERR